MYVWEAQLSALLVLVDDWLREVERNPEGGVLSVGGAQGIVTQDSAYSIVQK